MSAAEPVIIPGSVLSPFVPSDGARIVSVSPLNTTQLSDQIILDAYPNPFNKQVTVRFTATQTEPVALELYDFTGRLIRQVYTGHVSSGEKVEVNLAVEGLSQQMYIVRLVTPSQSVVHRLVQK